MIPLGINTPAEIGFKKIKKNNNNCFLKTPGYSWVLIFNNCDIKKTGDFFCQKFGKFTQRIFLISNFLKILVNFLRNVSPKKKTILTMGWFSFFLIFFLLFLFSGFLLLNFLEKNKEANQGPAVGW
jgi:hypothetical protein